MLKTGRIGPIRLGHLWIFPATLLLAWAPLQAESARKPLTSVAAVRHLSAAEAAKELPVDVTGVVTYSNPEEGDLFIQEGAGWVYVQPDKKYAIAPGSRVVVKGRTERVTARRSWPHRFRWRLGAAATAGFPQLPGSGGAGERLPLRHHAGHCAGCVVPDDAAGSSLYLLRMEDGGKMLDVVVRDYPQFSPSRLLDATVRVTGALGGTYDVTNDRILGLRLNVPSSNAHPRDA